MSDISRPYVRLEIYCEPKFFWDHFNKGWTQTPAGQVTIEEDTAKLTIKAGETEQYFEKAFTPVFDTSVYNYLIFRIIEATCDWVIGVQRADNSQWVPVAFGDSAGLFKVNLGPVYGGDIKGVRLYIEGSPGEYVIWDYVAIAKDYVFPPEGDITGKMEITKPLLNKEVAVANVNLSNFSGDSYLDISEVGKAIIWVSRNLTELGTTAAKVFGGKFASVNQEYFGYGVANVKLEIFGHAAGLFDSPELVYKLYAQENGQTIIEDALDLCNYVAKYPHGVGWFDEGGPYGSVDDRIDSSHDAEFDEVKPFTVIKELLDKAANPAGTVGFDMRETPSGVLIGHLRESADFTCPVSPTLRYAIKKLDAHRAKNRQKVYGATGKRIPEDEIWTESLDGWIVDSGTLSLEGTVKKEGSYSLSLYTVPDATVLIHRDISGVTYGFGKKAAKSLHLWQRRAIAGIGPDTARVELWAPDSSNYFYTGIKVFNDITERSLDFELGPNNEYNEVQNENGDWHKVGSPNWSQLTELALRITKGLESLGVFIDSLRFTDMPYSAEASDSGSISKHGIKEAEPVVDQTLLSDAECLARANGIIAKVKDAPVTLEPITVDGDYRYEPGDVMTDGVNSFRIIEVKHVIEKASWDTQLTVSEVI